MCQYHQVIVIFANENPSDQMELSQGTKAHMNHEDANRLFREAPHQRLLDKIAR